MCRKMKIYEFLLTNWHVAFMLSFIVAILEILISASFLVQMTLVPIV